MRIAIAGLVIAVIGTVATLLTVPDVRYVLRLDTPPQEGGPTPTPEQAGSTELADVGFTTVEDAYTALDIKVTNSREDPIFIKRADLRVKKIWTLTPTYRFDGQKCGAAFMGPSHTYDVKLPLDGAPYTISESLSQGIGPNENDRFIISLHPGEMLPPGETRFTYVFLMTVSLVYGGASNVLSSKDVLLAAESPGLAGKSYGPDTCLSAEDNLERLETQNARTMAEIERIEAPRNDYLEEISQAIR
jgi:hypothetical protein